MFILVSMNFIIIMDVYVCWVIWRKKIECVLKVMKLWFDLGEVISSSFFKKESVERSLLESIVWNCLLKVSLVCVWFML